ncbi:MAG: periplasmic heavy metal sensor [Candidatus Rokubacteria bacterium]|nr:periplasmic heavy metal sensor [Candidatus Rokubacteria bacterium]
MRTHTLVGLFLALLALAAPAAASEPAPPIPAAHDEVGRTWQDLMGRLQELDTRWREHFAPSPRGERPLISLMLRHKDELGLSPDQVQSLERLRADFQREAIRRDADLRIAEMDLAALLEREPVDLGQVETKVKEIERLRADLRLARIRAIEQGKVQLTPEQRAKLRSLLAEPGPPPRPRQGAVLQPRADQLFGFLRRGVGALHV